MTTANASARRSATPATADPAGLRHWRTVGHWRTVAALDHRRFTVHSLITRPPVDLITDHPDTQRASLGVRWRSQPGNFATGGSAALGVHGIVAGSVLDGVAWPMRRVQKIFRIIGGYVVFSLAA